jgi:hypothetical protein
VDLREVLRPGSAVLLVDWPSQDIPRSLLAAGFTVLSANLARGTASQYSLVPPGSPAPQPRDGVEVMAAQRDGDGPLLITRLVAMPARVDILCAYRPAEELAGIARRAADIGATTLWVQDKPLPDDARAVANAAGLRVVENRSIAAAVRELGLA